MDRRQIEQVRRFNRLVTGRVGALDESYLRRGRPLAEARLIFETGQDGAEVRALRARLGLDSGYLSRLLRSLEAQGLVAVTKGGGDGRRRLARLTPAGLAERAAYDLLSDDLAASILAPLDPAGRERLVRAMGEIENLIGAGTIEINVVAPDSAELRRCLAAYGRELRERFEGGYDPARSNPIPAADFVPPAGVFVVARRDGGAIGCGGLRRVDARTGEIKRMWTAPGARGQGVAGRILRRLEAFAREAGMTVLRLDTNRALVEAQNMYRRAGFREVAPFNTEAYAQHWFEKEL